MDRDLTIDEILAMDDEPKKDWREVKESEVFERKFCKKCKGTGRLPQYLHVKNGKCFECNGKGFWLVMKK